MKKRLLALCLAAALLVSLAPVLNLATGASAETIRHADKILTPGTGDEVKANTAGLSEGNDYTPAGTNYYFFPNVPAAGGLVTWGKYATESNNLALDHSKDITFMFQMQFNQFHNIGAGKKIFTTASGGVGINNIWYFQLNDSDAETGGFVYPFMYKENDQAYVQFLMPTTTYGNDVYSDPIALGTLSARFRLQLVWKANGNVDVYVANSNFVTSPAIEFVFGNFEYKGTVLDATWTRNTEVAAGVVDNFWTVGADSQGNRINGSDGDYFDTGIAFDQAASGYIWDTQITHTEPITDAEAYLTGEDIAVDNALNELSWRYAPWKNLVGVEGSAAVLMKNGEAYVALKSATATSATVTLGDNTKENVPFVNGVAEIKFTDASIDSLKETLAYSVTVTDGEKVGALEYTAVALNSQKVNTDLKGDGHYVETRWSADGTEVKEGAIYRNGIDFVSSDAGLMNYQRIGYGAFFGFTSSAGAAKWNHQNDIYAEFKLFTNDLPVTTNDGKFDAATEAYEGFSFHVLDRENNALITANIYNADAEGNLKVRILKGDRTDSDPIDLGIKVDDENGAARVGFLWTKEGAVIVMVNGEIKGTVENGTLAISATPTWTWTNPDSSDRMLAKLGTASGRIYIYEFAVRDVSMDPNEVVTQQVALGDDLNFSFNANVGKTGTASATVNGQTYTADANGNIAINLAAAQMNDVVELTIVDESGMTSVKEYTIRDYALAILNDAEYADVHELVEAMLLYGAAAQTYFEHNDDALVTDGLNLTAPTAAPEADAAANITDGGLSDLGITYYGASLLFKNKTTLRFYFQVEGDIAAAAFYVGGPSGTPVTPKRAGENSSFYYIDVADINPQDLDEQVTIFVADVEFGGMLTTSITYSPANYMVNIYNSTDSAALKQLMVAMYNYSLYADEYLA